MQKISASPTLIVPNCEEFRPLPGSLYVSGKVQEKPQEERGIHLLNWKHNATSVKFLEIVETSQHEIEVNEFGSVISNKVQLRSASQVKSIFESNKQTDRIYIDITGMSHATWAPLLKSCVENEKKLSIIYVEPDGYTLSSAQTETQIYDLSERIQGVSPIPSFACLGEFQEDKICFIPLLGFEGTRFSHILENVQPIGDKTIPIIGIPGFKPEYPFITYAANRVPLIETKSWKNARFAPANCPFSVFNVLTQLKSEYSDYKFTISPIGTKPHALGAVLFAIKNPEKVELVYDHPVRRDGRTSGLNRLLVYGIDTFLGWQ